MATQETYMMPKVGWVCFHCGERFTTPGSAADHFGARPTDQAACLIRSAKTEDWLWPFAKLRQRFGS